MNDVRIAGFLAAVMFFCAAAGAQENRKRELKAPLPEQRATVLDLLKSFVGKEEFASLRFDRKDIANGYLSFSQPAADIFDERFVLFRDDDGAALIAYSFIGCGPVCAQEIGFFRVEGNAFVDVTERMISEEIVNALRADIAQAEQTMDYAGPLFVLPRYGKTIEVWLADDGEKTSTKLMELLWNGREFVMHD